MSDHFQSVLAGATVSPKPLNQDAYAVVRHAVPGYSLVAVADGVGTHIRAEVGAALAIEAVASGFLSADPSTLDIRSLFSSAAERLQGFADAEGIDEGRRASTFGTTLICAIETPHEIRMAYIGNGGLLRIQPALLGLQPWATWAHTNLLHPHSVMRNGKEVVTRLLSAAGPSLQCEPTVLALARDRQHDELLLLCTDGLWSADQLTFGTCAESKLWQAFEVPLAQVLSKLGDWVAGPRGARGDATAVLEPCLASLNREGLLDDDCTVAILLAGCPSVAVLS